MIKMKHGLHFYTDCLSLTLNNAFASLGDFNILRTVNPKLSWTGWKFSERTCPVLQKKKKENQFSSPILLVHVITKGWFSQSTMSTGSHVRTSLRTRLRTRLGFENRRTLVSTCTLTKKENPGLTFPDPFTRGFLVT